MDISLHQRAQALFDELVELPPEDRAAFLEQACGRNEALEALVRDLLRLDADAHERWDEVLSGAGIGEES